MQPSGAPETGRGEYSPHSQHGERAEWLHPLLSVGSPAPRLPLTSHTQRRGATFPTPKDSPTSQPPAATGPPEPAAASPTVSMDVPQGELQGRGQPGDVSPTLDSRAGGAPEPYSVVGPHVGPMTAGEQAEPGARDTPPPAAHPIGRNARRQAVSNGGPTGLSGLRALPTSQGTGDINRNYPGRASKGSVPGPLPELENWSYDPRWGSHDRWTWWP